MLLLQACIYSTILRLSIVAIVECCRKGMGCTSWHTVDLYQLQVMNISSNIYKCCPACWATCPTLFLGLYWTCYPAYRTAFIILHDPPPPLPSPPHPTAPPVFLTEEKHINNAYIYSIYYLTSVIPPTPIQDTNYNVIIYPNIVAISLMCES